MKIPIPCEFGNMAECNRRILPFYGVEWFKWTRGMEYTYFFMTNCKWNSNDFYTSSEETQPYEFTIPDILLVDDFIKDKGYPLKGRGYASGVFFLNEKTYVNFILTDQYLSHIRVQCDGKGEYVPNGDIIFPTGWDKEKQTRMCLKSYLQGKASEQKFENATQMNIFEFLS